MVKQDNTVIKQGDIKGYGEIPWPYR